MSEQKQIQCCNCGMLFFMPAYYHEMRHRDGKSFWCPAGHEQHFTETEVSKLRKERDGFERLLESTRTDLQRQRSLRRLAEKSATALRGHLTRHRNRNGARP
ncbi:MAG: hypothetical protein ACOZAM_14965 [Pseudomonadota bacterium]